MVGFHHHILHRNISRQGLASTLADGPFNLQEGTPMLDAFAVSKGMRSLTA